MRQYRSDNACWARRVLTLIKTRLSIALVVTTTLLLLTALPAAAITKNYQKDLDHPFVGLVAFYDAKGEFSHRCSGSLIDSRTLVTAGHCTDNEKGGVMASARVWFQQGAGANYDPATEMDPVTGYPDKCAAGTLGSKCATSDEMYNYGFDDFAGFPDTHDAGIVILDQAISMPFYGKLPAAGTLNKLLRQPGKQDVRFRMSGYGLSYASPVRVVSFRERLMADGKLVNLKSANNAGFNLQTQGNGKNRGGTCSSDSGGPVFYPRSSNTIVAVTSFGFNANCRGVDFAYRLDRNAVLGWIAAHS